MNLQAALNETRESESLEFKEQFNVNSKGGWLEIIKDIVAIANSGGGYLIFGLTDEGRPAGFDVTDILQVDPADITNKVFSYTGEHYGDFRITRCEKDGCTLAVIELDRARVPIVFSKPGNYSSGGGKTKNVFSMGSVYFRHGAKSEPCTSADLRAFVEREVERVKHSWLDGIRQVTEAPVGSRVLVFPPDKEHREIGVSFVDDPTLPAVRVEEEDLLRLYPYTFGTLTKKLRERYSDFLQNKKYHSIRKSVINNPDYCRVRLLNPDNPNSSRTVFYSPRIIEVFDEHYTRLATA